MKKPLSIVISLTLAFISHALGAGLPAFASDEDADKWLRDNSAFYKTMAEAVDKRGGYRIRTSTTFPRGAAGTENGQKWIELNTNLKGAERLSIHAFELTNLFQDAKHDELDAAVRDGKITTSQEFVILTALVEYDGTRLYRRVIDELEKVTGKLPQEMSPWDGPGRTKATDFDPPLAYDVLKVWLADPTYVKRNRELFDEQFQRRKKPDDKGSK